jgi:hypothetical protein
MVGHVTRVVTRDVYQIKTETNRSRDSIDLRQHYIVDTRQNEKSVVSIR